MECVGICRICGDKITFNLENYYVLGEHLVKNHPEFEITHFDVNGPRSRSKGRFSSKISFGTSSLRKSFSGRKKSKTEAKCTKSHLYRTTVETWRPGNDALKCEKCGFTGQPYIRKTRNKIAYNSLGAFFLLGCWPLCFLPMLMCGSTKTSVCCRRCGYCFGNYDKKKGQLIPKETESTANIPNLC